MKIIFSVWMRKNIACTRYKAISKEGGAAQSSNLMILQHPLSVYKLKKERHNFVMTGNTIFSITILESRNILRKWLDHPTPDWHQTEIFQLEAMNLEEVRANYRSVVLYHTHLYVIPPR